MANLTLAMCSTLAASGRIFNAVERDHSLPQNCPQTILIYTLVAGPACTWSVKKTRDIRLAKPITAWATDGEFGCPGQVSRWKLDVELMFRRQLGDL
jgi:hypothetical protein